MSTSRSINILQPPIGYCRHEPWKIFKIFIAPLSVQMTSVLAIAKITIFVLCMVTYLSILENAYLHFIFWEITVYNNW